LGYEDEKFSYIIMSKKELSAPQDRIVGHPKISSGFAEFEVCSVEGALETKKILKRNVENFGILKKLEWGNVLIE
jgi:ribosomal protein RSM22 (predicted rRNA methylase)